MSPERVDVLIVGAGLSGIGAACHLRTRCPDKTYLILEAREAIGGTWDLFRYPGIRSDSDMFTLGYSFRPWTGRQAIADGQTIREYVRATAREYQVDGHIRFRHAVERAEWSSHTGRWTVTARGPDGTVTVECAFLWVCTGYYRYDEGYTPAFPDRERYRGPVVHPQAWPPDLAYAGRHVLVIGSGATAVTLVPALARDAAHVTMVQRSPSYVLSLPSRDGLADLLRTRLPARVAYPIIRWKNALLALFGYRLSRRLPGLVRRLLRKGVAARLPAGYDVATHFAPRYRPWDQRLCIAPDGDLFTAISDGRASLVTGQVASFTERGVRLASGEELTADIVVTATGLNLLALGGLRLVVDGEPVELADTVAYKAMLSGVPNLAMTVGYTNASWTLKADLIAEYVCRVLTHLDRHGYQVITPVSPEPGERAPLFDLTSGYVVRGAGALPKQSRRSPWRLYQSYPRDVLLLRYGRIAGKGVRLTRTPAAVPTVVRDAAL
jgi:cation diffusion facilitator CzcD-associated flavoprotein CzcO